ncbi:MAG: cytochrome d ubiquinol oxidase subunit II [Acidobacteriota bacterium]
MKTDALIPRRRKNGCSLVIPYSVWSGSWISFSISSLIFIGLWGIIGSIHYPNLVKASNDSSLSLTIYNTSSGELSLKIMLMFALVGLPIVIAYTAFVYKIFKGKVTINNKL